MLALAVKPRLLSASPASEAASWHKARKFVDLPFGRVAYVEKGKGPAALFIHGWSLNGYQWRGALDRLHTQRRCLAKHALPVLRRQLVRGFSHLDWIGAIQAVQGAAMRQLGNE